MDKKDKKLDWKSIKINLQAFDLILFRGGDIISDTIVEITKTEGQEWSHVGVVLTGKEISKIKKKYQPKNFIDSDLFVWESTQSGSLGDGVYNTQNKSFLGVQIRHLDKVVEKYSTDKPSPQMQIGFATLLPHIREELNNDEQTQQRFLEAFKKWNGTFYDGNCLSLLGAVFPSFRKLRNSCLLTCFCVNEWQFCSELVANLYIKLKIFPPTVRADNVIPVDFLPSLQGGMEGTLDKDKEIPKVVDQVVIVSD